MKMTQYQFSYETFDSIQELKEEDAALLRKAHETTQEAYAPYSQFRVAAVGRLNNGELIKGTNQENASYPAGICAERVLLSALSSLYPSGILGNIAITYHTSKQANNHPIFPCGICRQSLLEQQERQGMPIRLILGGMDGPVFIIPDSANLMPFAFSKENLI
jgi:cytidine deaminase